MLVPCAAMTSKAMECARMSVLGERYCTQHLLAIAIAEDEDRRKAKLRRELDTRLDAYIAWAEAHPSVWDSRRGGGGGGESNPASLEVAAPGTETVSAGPAGPTGQLTPVVWSASSGDPAPVRK